MIGPTRMVTAWVMAGPKTIQEILERKWWTQQDLNLRPLACEASALTGLSYASTGSWIIAPSANAGKSAHCGALSAIALASYYRSAEEGRADTKGSGRIALETFYLNGD